jgi:hypothetical protein
MRQSIEFAVYNDVVGLDNFGPQRILNSTFE